MNDFSDALYFMCRDEGTSTRVKAEALRWLAHHGVTVTASALSKCCRVNVRTAQRHMVRLEELGYAERSPNTWGHEVVWQKGPKLR